MTRYLWPKGLPCPDLKAINYRPDGGALQTEMASGKLRSRRLYSHLPTTYSATLTLTSLEVAVLMALYDKTVGVEFEIDVHSPFLVGQPLTRHRAEFLDLPDISEFTTKEWKAAIVLRLAHVDVPDYDDLSLIAAYGREAARVALSFDVLTNERIPEHMGEA